MTHLQRFDVPGQPVGKERPRVRRVGKASGLYTPAKTVSYERAIGYRAKQAMRGKKQKRYSDQPGVEVYVWLAQEDQK